MLRFSLLSLAFLLGPILGCAGVRAPYPGTELDTRPVILSLSPSSGRAGDAYPVRVTIEGHGFAETGNIVTFGGVPGQSLPSSGGGTEIVFWVPKEAPSTGEVPPMVLTPGEYPVTVTTSAGASEPAVFTLTAGE